MEQIECPYCLREQLIDTSDIHEEDEAYEEECGYCGKTFNVFVSYHVRYKSARIEPETPC